MSTRDGGPAFAHAGDLSRDVRTQNGMSVRQYYKAAALQGFLANPSVTEHPAFTSDALVAECGHYADAMLAEDEHAAKAGES